MAWLGLWLAAAGLAAAQRIGDALARRVTAVAPAAIKDVRFDVPVTNGLVLHLAADAIEGLRDGDPVAQWDDQSAHGNHALQGTPDKRPTFKTAAANGLPVVRFANPVKGNNELTAPSVISGTQARTLVVVVRPDTIGIHGIFSLTDAGGYGNGQDFTPTPEIFVRVWQRQDFDRAMQTTRLNVLTLRMVAAGQIGDIEGWLDGAKMTGTPTAAAAINTKTGQTTVGYHDQAWADFSGDIAALLIYDRALSDTERQAVEQYLIEKWMDW